jgi:glutamate/tyrosine decarboxylase-like PLP-dependent enzyme
VVIVLDEHRNDEDSTQMIWKELLFDTAVRAERYLAGLSSRSVAPSQLDVDRLQALDGPLQNESLPPADVLAELDDNASPATVASAGGRYFGFVTGGTLPAALSANWMAGAWDQNAAMQVMSPTAARLEEIVLRWLLDLLSLPPASGVGFVTGTTMANFTALSAARSALLRRAGWNVEDDGLFGAPALNVVVGAEVHVSLLKALTMLGLGRARVTRVPADEQGRMLAADLPPLNETTIVCVQAGNVNSGAFDPAGEVCARARDAGAWVHVDGAFGYWAAVSPRYAPLLAGAGEADSWAIDCHKWMNVPYDSAIAVVRSREALQTAMLISAAYLTPGGGREPWHYAPEASRRARGVELWAAMRSLGRNGICELIERNCRQAQMFASRLRAAGFTILNEVVLNQVLVSFGNEERTRRVIARVQRDGTCWCGATVWHGRAAMRISVSSWATTDEDVERSVEAMIRLASQEETKPWAQN